MVQKDKQPEWHDEAKVRANPRALASIPRASPSTGVPFAFSGGNPRP